MLASFLSEDRIAKSVLATQSAFTGFFAILNIVFPYVLYMAAPSLLIAQTRLVGFVMAGMSCLGLLALFRFEATGFMRTCCLALSILHGMLFLGVSSMVLSGLGSHFLCLAHLSFAVCLVILIYAYPDSAT